MRKPSQLLAALLIVAVTAVSCVSSSNPPSQSSSAPQESTSQPSSQPSPTSSAPVESQSSSTSQESDGQPTSHPESLPPARIEAAVTRVIDGDTIEVLIVGVPYSVRYIGIDTPEVGWPGADEATQANAGLVEGKIVELEKDVSETDEYGRLLRYVWVNGQMVNATLVYDGYAEAIPYPPDLLYQDYLLALQTQAAEAGRGLWTAADQPAPTPSLPSESVDVRITRIYYDGQVPSSESDEYVEIQNLGGEPVDLAGWRLVDVSEGYPSLTFPSHILEPGQIVRVYTNEIHPEYGGFSFASGKAVWNNSDPDTAVLYDVQGQEMSRMSY